MNKDNYKSAINQIHAKDELKDETFEKIKEQNKNTTSISIYLKHLSVCCAIVVVVFTLGFAEFSSKLEKENVAEVPKITEKTSIAKKENELPRFKNMNELKSVLNNNKNTNKKNGLIYGTEEMEMAIDSVTTTDSIKNAESNKLDLSESKTRGNYSKTNVQVENVDEADIVKTDGEFIYYVSNGNVYIVNADNLEIASIIKIREDKRRFSPVEIFINNNKLIVLGNVYEYEERLESFKEEISSDMVRINNYNSAKAFVYDISDKSNVKILRELGLEGNYVSSRMIDDNIYFISSRYAYYDNNLKDYEILPIIEDSVAEENRKNIDCTDIAYFKGTDNYNYMLVGGFNINNNDEMNVETFFGASDNIYASENNLYITQNKYSHDDVNTIIYKFNLENSKIILQCKGEVQGSLNNQFSMDEYDGNLRVATTYMKNNDKEYKNSTTSITKEITTSNRLYIFDDNLKEIGKIDNLAEDEKIYSVRFIGKMGYIVTFQEVDPLFVIDLSDPTNPQVKGELKIPGYSSYLHPYDENHIIGIGYNVKPNGYGGVTNDKMKMSMFDVSDVENPKEMFSIDIGEKYTYSNVIQNHKALFYNKLENLIGFPISYNSKNGIAIFKIDLENGFEKYGEITNEHDYSYIERFIYIEDRIYTLDYNKIVSYNLETLEKINEVKLDRNL